MSAPTTRLPTFVPRLVAASERIASGVARRVTARVRAVGARAMSFADRVVGSWLGPSSTWSTSWSTSWSSPAAQERQAARAAARVGGAFVMTRPWYELPALDAIGAAPAAAAEPTVAERGAQIARTQLDAEAPRAERVESAPARDVTAAEALGLHVQAAPMVRAPVAPRSPIERALGHAAWVDTQLRAPAASYVYVAPAEAPRAADDARPVAASPSPFALPELRMSSELAAQPSALSAPARLLRFVE